MGRPVEARHPDIPSAKYGAGLQTSPSSLLEGDRMFARREALRLRGGGSALHAVEDAQVIRAGWEQNAEQAVL